MEALYLLGRMYFQTGNFTEALWYFNQFRKLDSYPKTVFSIAQTLHRLGANRKRSRNITQF